MQPGENRRGLEVAEVGLVVLSRRGQYGKVRVTAEYQDEENSSVLVELAEGLREFGEPPEAFHHAGDRYLHDAVTVADHEL